MTMTLLERAFEELRIPYDGVIMDRFQKYMQGILTWNEKINLTAITEEEEFIKKHYMDSVACYGFPEIQKAERLIDVGTGGGFPGVPLAILFPQKQFVLMDSLKKRLNIIDDLTSDLGITNVTTLHGRAEDLGQSKEHREQYDICISRAVANLATLSEYCLPFVKPEGAFLAYKGVKAEEEVREGKKAIALLGGQISREESIPFSNYDMDHLIIVINKVQKTPAKYPRKAGTPSKEPLK
ncbi:16S rRNA (guanine(527)-N(7))-methyltransferase RsmG [Aminipila butyrica]|uniref:Ribosomal RNA small subunit methyltransferase G n=1 Tax=Aminipila butyrica TaxID=433296 RepID=A0A858BQ49_9FIRM|nr:16S rRNA (guanine(527)-N(7))-methyltransferase RsmG [Aminipila butyrica]QIB67923.1 16S rRNA (guanine(527)-N(7))-methyltransferase RsmG [Aminipila butyrica]